MAVLDRVFTTTDLEAQYPLINVKGASRLGSDHVPLLVNFGTNQEKKPFLFRFEKWWLQQEGFLDIVKKCWESLCHHTDPLERWQFKLRSLRRKLKGWSLNLNSELKKKKQALLEEFDVLDVFSEENNLDDGERARLQEVKCELEHIWQMEETKAKQRSRDRFIKEGDRNTAYFQALANQRNRKKNINALLGPEGECVENKGMLEIVTNFYKKLFGYEQKPDIHLEDSFWEPDEMISIAENEMLDAPLTEEEIKSSIFGSYADGAPGPDGFPFLFWNKSKDDIVESSNI